MVANVNDADDRMRRAFWEKANSLLREADRYSAPLNSDFCIGSETEFYLTNQNYQPVSERLRDSIIKALNSVTRNDLTADVELGAAQLETRTTPHDLTKGWDSFIDQSLLIEHALRDVSGQSDIVVLRTGSFPLLPTAGVPRTSRTKYDSVPTFHNEHRDPLVSRSIGIRARLDVSDASVVALCSAFQCSVDALSIADAVDKVNRSFALAPYMTAISGNARFLDFSDSGLSDLRSLAWERSHDVRSSDDVFEGVPLRVGLPRRYYDSLLDYFSDATAYPFILDDVDHAFQIGIGLLWRDARIKFNEDRGRSYVEFRPISTQPTLDEDIAMAMFYVGRLLWSQRTSEAFLDFGRLRENRYGSLRLGLDAYLWFWRDQCFVPLLAREGLREEIARARSGLEVSGLASSAVDDKLSLLVSRLHEGNPSEQLAKKVLQYTTKGMILGEALIMAFNEQPRGV